MLWSSSETVRRRRFEMFGIGCPLQGFVAVGTPGSSRVSLLTVTLPPRSSAALALPMHLFWNVQLFPLGVCQMICHEIYLFLFSQLLRVVTSCPYF